MIKGAVFDLDHTLFDRYATLAAILPAFCSHFEMGMDIESATALMIEADKKCVHNGWGKVLEYLSERGFFAKVPTLEEYTEALLSEFRKKSVEYPFTKPMLDELHAMGIKTGLITNGRSAVQRGKLAQLTLEPYLDEIIISGEFGEQKPKPGPYLAMAERLGFRPDELIYVGDNPSTDILGARAAGYIPVWVATLGWWSIPEIEKTEYSVNDVSEIPALIRKMNGEA